jgi:KDO2-lipid IV(A) lauroyltransferase
MRALPERRAMAARHQRRAGATDVDAAVRGAFDSYARYWLELLRLPGDMRRNDVATHIDAEGYEHIEAALERGHGLIVALPHVGGWESAGAWMHTLGHDMVAVAEPLEPPEFYEWFEDQRKAFGVEIVPLGPDASTRVSRALRENRVVGLLSDRDLNGEGIEVEFFGERTTLPGGPATMALRTGATLLCAGTYFGPGRRQHMVIRAPILTERQGRLRDDIARITQDMAREFEVLIRRAPEQWHLMQPNWPSDMLTGGNGRNREGVTESCES